MEHLVGWSINILIESILRKVLSTPSARMLITPAILYTHIGRVSLHQWLFGATICAGTICLFKFIYIRYRIWSAGAQVIYTKAYPWLSQLFSPFILYKGMSYHSRYYSTLLAFAAFQVRSDDVLIAGFPRSGTTWVEEMVYLIVNDADTDKARSERHDMRVPYLDHIPGMTALVSRPSPRVYKTHFHYDVLFGEAEAMRSKIIYVWRNPKDVAVSYYNLFRKFNFPLTADFDDYIDCFLDGTVLFAPWPDHIRGFWKRRHQENILFLKYEEMQKDVYGTVRKLASFLGRTLTDEQVYTIVQHTSFNNMKQNKQTNFLWFDASGLTKNLGDSFIRKGQVGDWKNHLSPTQSAQIDKMVTDALRETDLVVEYEIDLKH